MKNERKLTVGSLKGGSKSLSETDHQNEKNLQSEQKVNEPEKIPQIKLIQNDKEYTVQPTQERKTLLDTALDQSKSLDYKCKKGTCGKCKVKILHGGNLLRAVTEQERKMLKQEEVEYRLACQAVIK